MIKFIGTPKIILWHSVLMSYFLAFSMQLKAYELVTHEYLSEQAINQSSLATTPILHEYGIEFESFYNVPLGSYNVSAKPTDLVGLGARLEDANGRVVHHFFDPQKSTFLSETEESVFDKNYGFKIIIPPVVDSAPTIGFKFAASPIWALDKHSVWDYILDKSVFLQSYSYKDARSYEYRGLTATTKLERDSSWGLTFTALGHVIHHLQDMAQPQHVRDDIHFYDERLPKDLCGPGGFEAECGGVIQPSLYERKTEELVFDLSRADDISEEQKYDVVGAGPKFSETLNAVVPVTGYNGNCFSGFTRARQFWNNQGKGIAEYSSENFVTVDTNFDINGSFSMEQWDGLLPHADHPRPNGHEKDKTFLMLPATTVFGEKINKSGYIAFVGGYIEDKCNNTREYNPRLSSFSIFDQHLGKKGKKPIFSLNSFNYGERYKFLIPRAVGYSRGLIDFFFRGKLALRSVRDSSGSFKWVIDNKSDELMVGTFEVYYEAPDATGNRFPVALFTNITIAANSSSGYLTINMPQHSQDYDVFLVFRGKLGEEVDNITAAKTRIQIIRPTIYVSNEIVAGVEKIVFNNPSDYQLLGDVQICANEGKGYCLKEAQFSGDGWDMNISPLSAQAKSVYFPSRNAYQRRFRFIGTASGYPAFFQTDDVFLPKPEGCGASAESGGTSYHVFYYSLGSSPGYAGIKYNTVKIPDKISVSLGDVVKSTTAIKVSGSGSLSFYYNPANSSSNLMKVQVWGNENSETIWSYETRCPSANDF